MIQQFRRIQRICQVQRLFFSSQPQKLTEGEQKLTEGEKPAIIRDKFDTPLEQQKIGTGYAFLDVEPFPYKKLNKIALNIMHKLQQVPETSMYRIYTEEKCKYILKLVDEIQDVRQLEEELGFESIELFIQAFSKELDLVDYMKDVKPWEPREDEQDAICLQFANKVRDDVLNKHRRLDKPDREKNKFIE